MTATRCKSPYTARGFTLLEVLVSLAIVALAISAALASVSQQVRAATLIQERTYAGWIAQNKLTEIRLGGESLEVRETTEEVRFAELDWDLEINIAESGVENLYRVDISVAYAGDENVVGRLIGLVGEPGIPGQANSAWTVDRQPRPEGDER